MSLQNREQSIIECMRELKIVRVPVLLEAVDVTSELARSEFFPELNSYHANCI